MKLQLCAAGLAVLCLISCSRSMRAATGATASDGGADGIPGAMAADAATIDAVAPDSPGASRKPDDAGSALQKDAEPSSSDDDGGATATPPMAADASAAPDPLGGDPEPSGPHIAIDFPPSDARTDRAELRVRGRLVAAKGGTLTLNGASVPVDAAGGWSTQVQLALGKNALQFELALNDERFHATRNVRSEPTLHYPGAVAIDPTNNRGYVADRDTLQSVDLETGERRLISGPERGQGPALSGPRSILVDAANQRAFVGAAGPAVFTVDLRSGDRRVSTVPGANGLESVLALSLAADGRVLVTSDAISWFDPTTGVTTPLTPKPAIELPVDPNWPTTIRQIVLKNGSEQAYVAVAGGTFGLYSTNLTTGASTLVSNATRGTGPEPVVVSSMLLSPSADAVYIAGHLGGYEMAIVHVDLQTGDRTIVTHQDRGTGPNFEPQIAFDVARGRLISPFRDGVLSITLGTGDRTVISSNQTGDRFFMEMTHGLWVTPDGRHVVAVHPGSTVEPGLLAIDLRSGERRLVVEHLPAGEHIGFDSGVAPLRAVWVIDRFRDAVWTVGLQDGVRDLVSAPGVGQGPVLQDPQQIAFDAAADARHAYVLDWRTSSAPGVGVPSALVRVDLSNGDRTVVSDQSTGTGPNGGFERLALDAKRKRAIALSADADGYYFLTIDLQTAQRGRVGSSFALEDVYQSEVVLDAAGDRMLVASADRGLLAIDLESGEHKQLSTARLGPEIGGVRGLTTVPGRQLAVMLCYGSVIVVDLSTGERVIVS